jgi:hypothetical protein
MSSRPQFTNPLKRKASPRLLSFIESRLQAFSTKKQAAEALGISPTELSFFVQGTRTPSPEGILKLLTVGASNRGAPTVGSGFCRTFDQRLLDSGLSTIFFKHLRPAEQFISLLRRHQSGFTLHESADLPQFLSDISFACRRPDIELVFLDDGPASAYLLLEPICDDTDLVDGDMALFTFEEKSGGSGDYYFGLFGRDGNDVRLSAIDPATMKPLNAKGSKTVGRVEDIDLRARVVLRLNEPVGPVQPPNTKQRRGAINKLDKLRVGYSPFQDALLVFVGTELGFFEEEGLLVEPEAVDWYEWQTFFEQDGSPSLAFGNIFSFVREFGEAPDLRFLYGVNLFDDGFALLNRGDVNTANIFAGPNIIPVRTVAESDWAAQLYSYCKDNEYNFSIRYGPHEIPVLSVEPDPARPTKPTIVVIDSSRREGVLTDPAQINKSQQFYFGSIPQRMRLTEDYNWKVLVRTMRSPYPINGFVGSKEIYTDHKDLLLRFLKVWFRIVNYLQPEIGPDGNPAPAAHAASRIVERAFEKGLFDAKVPKLEIKATRRGDPNEIVKAWQLEKFPTTPLGIEKVILREDGAEAPWKSDAKRAIAYLQDTSAKTDVAKNARWTALQSELDATDRPQLDKRVFLLDAVHEDYVALYGRGRLIRKQFQGAPPLEQSSVNTLSKV